MKKRILSALCSLMLLSVLSITAFAVEVPDFDRKGAISITMAYQGKAVAGGSLTLVRVADVYVENGADYSFRYTQDYADCQVALDNLDDSKTALALAEYSEKNNLPGKKVQIDKEGHITFTELELGLYLLVQQDAADGYEPVSPFLVSVPAMKDGSYIYNVDASPKLALELAPTETTEPSTEPPTEPTTPPQLPQTGLNQWPIPVLAIGGLLLVMLGLAFYTCGKKRSHES